MYTLYIPYLNRILKTLIIFFHGNAVWVVQLIFGGLSKHALNSKSIKILIDKRCFMQTSLHSKMAQINIDENGHCTKNEIVLCFSVIKVDLDVEDNNSCMVT
jgi:hypothetical protein